MIAKIIPVSKMSAKIEISAVNVTKYTIGPVPCNNTVNQILFFIAEESIKIAHADIITVVGYPMGSDEMFSTSIPLRMNIDKCKEIYKDVNFQFELQHPEEDAKLIEEVASAISDKKSTDLGVEGSPA